MKKLIPLGGLLIALLCIVACGERQDVAAYCESMANVPELNDKFSQNLNDLLLSGELEQADITHQDWLTDLQFQLKGVYSVGNFKADSSLVEAYRIGIGDLRAMVDNDYGNVLESLHNNAIDQVELEQEIETIGKGYANIIRKLKQENLAFKTKYEKGKK